MQIANRLDLKPLKLKNSKQPSKVAGKRPAKLSQPKDKGKKKGSPMQFRVEMGEVTTYASNFKVTPAEALKQPVVKVTINDIESAKNDCKI